jgi:hypothetical protein
MAAQQKLSSMKNRKAVKSGGKVSSLFDFCSFFFGFAQFPATDSVLIAAGREVITLPCCFNDRHGTGLPYHATFDLLRQCLLLNMHDKLISTHDKTIINLSVHYK